MRRLPSADDGHDDGSEPRPVALPDPDLVEVTGEREDLPLALRVDRALTGLPAGVFDWLLSVTLALEETDEDGLPSAGEREVVDGFAERLSEALLDLEEEDDPGPVNALFLACVDWNGTRELAYRVHDPEVADDLLQFVIESGDYPRPFAYRLTEDPDGARAAEYLP